MQHATENLKQYYTKKFLDEHFKLKKSSWKRVDQLSIIEHNLQIHTYKLVDKSAPFKAQLINTNIGKYQHNCILLLLYTIQRVLFYIFFSSNLNGGLNVVVVLEFTIINDDD